MKNLERTNTQFLKFPLTHLLLLSCIFMMIDMKACVIGCGNLGSSFIEGLVKSEAFKPGDLTASDPDEDKLKDIKDLGVETTTDNGEAAENSELIFLAIKPSLVDKVLDDLELNEDNLLVSLAAGVSTDFLSKHTEARIVRVMPNICGSVLEMASAYTLGENTTPEDEKLVAEILNRLGKTSKVEEKLMDAVTGLSGSGPAYVFLIIKALEEAGIEIGLSESQSSELSAQTVKGSAELVLNSDESLEELIDTVCSPKGTTIEGVKVLEEEKIQEALKEAVRAATDRSKELSK